MSRLVARGLHSYASALGRAIYLDKRMVVVDKLPGIDSQVGMSRLHEVSANNLVVLPELEESMKAENNTLFPVHRLDKGTTGCLVFARRKDMARELSQQLQLKMIDKTYYAIVRGGRGTFKQGKGVIDSPVAEFTEDRFEGEPNGDPKPSVTEWQVVGISPTLPLSLLKLRLLTGHKHQLRIHLAKVLHAPILGDSRHTISRPTKGILDTLKTLRIPHDRLFLHSSRIELYRHSNRKRRRLGVQVPLPTDFVELLRHLRIPFDPEISFGKLTLDGKTLPYGDIPEFEGRLFL